MGGREDLLSPLSSAFSSGYSEGGEGKGGEEGKTSSPLFPLPLAQATPKEGRGKEGRKGRPPLLSFLCL